MARLHRQIMRLLISEIVAGTYTEGGRMPRENDLAQEFGVSRGVVREALRGLEERGLIRVRHGHGATVASTREWNIFDGEVLEALLRTPVGTAALGEFLECRRVLEVEAAGLAAERADATHLAAMADALARLQAIAHRSATNPSAEDLYHEADIEFHRAIIAATGNRAFARVLDPVRQALITARRPTARPEERLERTIPEHKAILAAIANRDAEGAREAMARHFATIEAYLRDYAERQRRALEGANQGSR